MNHDVDGLEIVMVSSIDETDHDIHTYVHD